MHNTLINKALVSAGLWILLGVGMPATGQGIDRKTVVTRHNPITYASAKQSPAQVGNGRFAFGADITGAQTFRAFNTLSDWGWHSFPLPEGHSLDEYHPQEVESWGQSIPYLLRDPEHPEINRFRFELQMRSALQHVWAAMNHDIGYKSSVEVPPEHLRSLTRLAGILELADEEFSRIRKELSDYRRKAEQLVKDGSFDEVSLDGDTWRSYLALDPFASLNNKIAAINQAEVQPLSGMPYLEPLLKLGMKTLGDVENMRKRYADKAYRLALHQITGTDLDIIASTLGLQNLCIVYAAERDGEKGIEFFLDCLNGPSKYNAESARRICAQLKKLHDR